MMQQPAVTMAAAPLAAPPVVADAAPAAPVGHTVKSPMVGTFYRSASPGAKAFVEVGSVVKEGETICIIEAMKILNEIEADKAGTITRVLSGNGEAVEYGPPLFIIDLVGPLPACPTRQTRLFDAFSKKFLSPT